MALEAFLHMLLIGLKFGPKGKRGWATVIKALKLFYLDAYLGVWTVTYYPYSLVLDTILLLLLLHIHKKLYLIYISFSSLTHLYPIFFKNL